MTCSSLDFNISSLTNIVINTENLHMPVLNKDNTVVSLKLHNDLLELRKLIYLSKKLTDNILLYDTYLRPINSMLKLDVISNEQMSQLSIDDNIMYM